MIDGDKSESRFPKVLESPGFFKFPWKRKIKKQRNDSLSDKDESEDRRKNDYLEINEIARG